MAERLKTHPPEVVRENCQKFLAALETYRAWLQENADEYGRRAGAGPVRQLWIDLDEYGSRLLAAGNSWNMSEWIAKNQEWLPLERAGFFEGDAVEDDVVDTSFSQEWGLDLKRFIAWAKLLGNPLGFGGNEREVNPSLCEWVIEDVERDVRALLAAANDLVLGTPGKIDVRPRLTPRESAVLELISSTVEEGISGKDIVKKLEKSETPVGQSDLTKDIIPKLKAYYGVRNRLTVGYYRIKLA